MVTAERKLDLGKVIKCHMKKEVNIVKLPQIKLLWFKNLLEEINTEFYILTE